MDPHPTPPMGITPVVLDPVELLRDCWQYIARARFGNPDAALLLEKIETLLTHVDAPKFNSSQNETDRPD